jgi:hypothetical protein
MKGFKRLSSIVVLLFAFAYSPSLPEAKASSLNNVPSEQSVATETNLVEDKTGELLIAQRRDERWQYRERGYERPVYRERGYERPVYRQRGYERPVYRQRGYGRPVYRQRGYGRPVYRQRGYGRPVYRQRGYGRPAGVYIRL